jgi:ribosomal-protein-alanine N-acetyltransferase
MAFIDSIRSIFIPGHRPSADEAVPAASAEYHVRPLTRKQLGEVIRLNLRCFANGDNYSKYTFEYLFEQPRLLSYRIVTPDDRMVAFGFALANDNGSAHLTTIGVAPEHRRRGLAQRLLTHLETAASARGLGTMVLEVRVSNFKALQLYKKLGYAVVQRISGYYRDGEDCFLMMKPLSV